MPEAARANGRRLGQSFVGAQLTLLSLSLGSKRWAKLASWRWTGSELEDCPDDGLACTEGGLQSRKVVAANFRWFAPPC